MTCPNRTGYRTVPGPRGASGSIPCQVPTMPRERDESAARRRRPPAGFAQQRAQVAEPVRGIHPLRPFGNSEPSRQLVLYWQPIEVLGTASAPDAGMDGERFELLLRVMHEDGRVEGPSSLIAAIEHDGLGSMLDRFVFGSLLDWVNAHPGRARRIQQCFINLTTDALLDGEWLGEVRHCLGRERQVAEKICFEISERTPASALSAAGGVIEDLRALGCRFALDDFGKSNATYEFLREISCDFLKIDGELVRGIEHSGVDRSIVGSIVSLAHELDKPVIAEGVENPQVRSMLAGMGVDFGQGFHLGMPRPLGEMSVGLH